MSEQDLVPYGSGSGGITSINANNVPAQVIQGSPNISVNSASGTTTIANIPIAVVTGINGLTTGSTLLYTNNSGLSLLVEDVVPIVTAVTGTGNGPTIQIGSTPTGADVYASIAMTALTVVGRAYHFGDPGMSIVIPNGGSLYADITLAATTASLTLKIAIIGYFV